MTDFLDDEFDHGDDLDMAHIKKMAAIIASFPKGQGYLGRRPPKSVRQRGIEVLDKYIRRDIPRLKGRGK